MGDIDVDTAPVTAPVEDGLATTETGLDEIPSEPSAVPPGLPAVPSEREGSISRRRFVRPVAAVAGLIIVVVVGVLIWSLWPDPAPQAPQSLRIEATQAASVELQWDAPSDGPSADSYVILFGEEEVGSVDAPDTSYVVTSLDPNTRYEFAVVSVDGDRRSEPSEVIAVTTDPGVPSSLQIEDRGATSARLVWDAPPGPSVDAYVILNEGDEVGVVRHPETSFAVVDLIPGATYEFAVVAQDGPRRSLPVWKTVTAIAPSPGEAASDPAANTTDTIVLTWSPPVGAGAPTQYMIIRDGETVANVPGDTLSHMDTGLAPATAYEYSVAADWGFEPSEPTNAIVAATAEPPVADARLVGSWPVDVTMVEDPGGNMDVGTTWTSTWEFEPSCDAGACDVTLAGNDNPPGFNRHSFTIDLIRDGASYAGSTTAQITYCDSVPVENTVTARLTVDTAGVDDGTWVANSWTGTLEISSPYTEVGERYCPADAIRQELAATR